MADPKPTTTNFVAFWHDNAIEASAIAADPDAALKAGTALLAARDALFDGDALMVTALTPPTLIQRGLA
jgi:hypothetical protein